MLQRSEQTGRLRLAALALAAGMAMLNAHAAQAACRVTDFTDRSLSSLNEVQRLSFVTEMTSTEYARLKAAPAGDANHFPLITASASLPEARQAALGRIVALDIENSIEFAHIWRSDYLTDEKLRELTTCSSLRAPGLHFAGRPDGPGTFNLTLTHMTPVGVEKISLRLVSSYNIANIAEFEATISAMGMRNLFNAQTYALKLADPSKRAVITLRSGYETPVTIYIPPYPAPAIRPEETRP